MKRIIDGRGTGKTMRLFQEAKEQNAVVVCSNPAAFADKAIRYGIVGLKFMSYNDFLEGNYEPGDNTVVVDELEELLRVFCNYDPMSEIIGYTLSVED